MTVYEKKDKTPKRNNRKGVVKNESVLNTFVSVGVPDIRDFTQWLHVHEEFKFLLGNNDRILQYFSNVDF